jgi:hypothetical protein
MSADHHDQVARRAGQVFVGTKITSRRIRRNPRKFRPHFLNYFVAPAVEYFDRFGDSGQPDHVLDVIVKIDHADPGNTHLIFVHQEVEAKWMAFTFWCTFNGFANISRNFVMPFFNYDKNRANIYLDSYIEKCFKKEKIYLKTSFIDANIKSNSLPKVDPGTPKDDKISIFFENFLNRKYKLSIEQFRSVANLNDRDKMINELKNRYRISKKDSSKLLDQFEDILRTPSLF